MDFFTDFPYWVDTLFAAFHIAFAFVLLFGLIAPLFLSYTRGLPLIEKIIYCWVGLGGIILFSIFLLATLHIYDFISISLVLLLIPLVLNIWRSDTPSILAYFEQWELNTVVKHLRIIEDSHWSVWSAIKAKIISKKPINLREASRGFLVIGIALAGGLIRMFPALQNAAPFSRGWFIHLNRIKNIRLQHYFTDYPEPAGMHSLVSFFSMLTQLNPEMILHILGALSSFFLCIIIYWAAKDITKNKYSLAPVCGMAIYALVPMLLIPVSFDQQIEAGSLDLALCFAIPTITIFIRNLRNSFKSPWFYVLSGFIATAMINLFVAFLIELPLMLLGLFSLPRRNYLRSFYKVITYLITISAIVILPFIVGCMYYDVDIRLFFMSQLYSVEAYSYYPFLILPVDKLSSVYILIASALSVFYLGFWIKKRGRIRDELIFLAVFLIVSLVYTSLINFSNIIWLDVDQLNGFYAIMIAIFGGILFATVIEVLDLIFSMKEKTVLFCSWSLLAVLIGTLIFIQGGVKVSRTSPETVPNGFLKAYYKIADQRLPYTYATVGPDIQRIMAKNRNFFMDYQYFLDEYGAIDSTYNWQLQLPEQLRSMKEVPPASIFVFVIKAPYKSIQQGILYDAPSVMQDIEQWISNYRKLPGRIVKTYYSDKETTVYEIVNCKNESKLGDILNHIYPEQSDKKLFND